MIIERNGVLITLTEEELSVAYDEQQHKNNLDDARKHLEGNDFEIIDKKTLYEFIEKTFTTDERFLSHIAERFDHCFDTNRSEWDQWEDAVEYALKWVVDSIKKVLDYTEGIK